MKKWNKKGTDKILSVYWFAILFIVAGGVVYMATLYYGEPYDVREIEANFLINHIANCFSEGGVLVDDWKIINSDNLVSRCNLNFNVEDTKGWKNDQYFLKVSYAGFNTGDFSLLAKEGNSNLESFCKQKGDSLPVCVERSFYTIDSENTQYEIKILGVVRKTEKNVM